MKTRLDVDKVRESFKGRKKNLKKRNDMKLGYMAVGNRGTTHHLTEPGRHPRRQLLDKCGRSHADKMYVDHTGGPPTHIGYIVGGEWFSVYEVHTWNGGK
jgi:hypothetical protein